MNPGEIQAMIQTLHESLLEQKSLILNKSYEFRQEQCNRAPVSDESEAASGNLEDSISIHLHERDRRTLYQIERALGKIADGTYGQCEACAYPIGPRRLQVHPFSTLCVSCMEEQESHPRQ
ncbi:MAG: TraR/DksA family transcriptional regulator [Bdellovibrionaceae bacterium]|nr:TraR/DksA family transcriptional regulator [Pseudobdellovibrionaceae bacterium]MBX3033622.1 TraR/DksA family transcriptional regulator [Pseudobdellovibrionaceae bacterium]